MKGGPPLALYGFAGKAPRVAPDAFVAPGAHLSGDVEVAAGASIWFNAVVRADLDRVRIGRGSNLQDGCVVHCDEGKPCLIGADVSVGHGAVLHGCTVGDGALIGMGAIVLNGAEVGAGAIVAAGAVVPEGATIPPGMLAMGVPARVLRAVRPDERERARLGAEHYQSLARAYRQASS